MDGLPRHDEVDRLEARLTQRGSPYALECLDTKFGPIKQFVHCTNYLDDIFKKAEKRGDRPFVVTEAGTISYGQLFSRAAMVARSISADFKIGVGDRVALDIANSPEWIASFFAVIASGATPVLLNNWSEDVMRDCLRIVNCKLAISQSDRLLALRGAGHTGAILEVGAGQENLDPAHAGDHFDQQKGGTVVRPAPGLDSEALISFTSGSTGTPKAVVSSHRAVTTGLMNMMLSGTLASAETKRERTAAATPPCSLILAPLSYVAGYTQVLLASMLGGKFALLSGQGVGNVLDFVSRENVTSITGLSQELSFALLQADNAPERLSSLRSWNVSGAALRQSVIRKIVEKLPNVVLSTGYGLTETNGGICSIAGDSLLKGGRSSGRLVPTAEIKIVDRAGSPVNDGEVGDIHLRGPMLMSGYLNGDGSLRGLVEGWFATGDAGYLGVNRQLHVLDRVGDVLTFGEQVVSTGEIERFVIDMPGVEGASVVCLLRESGEKCLGMVLLRDDAEEIDIPATKQMVSSKYGLEDDQLLIVLSDELPRTASGKVSKSEIEALFVTRWAVLQN